MEFLRRSLAKRYANGHLNDIIWGIVEKTAIVIAGTFLTMYITMGKLEVKLDMLEKQVSTLADCFNQHLQSSIPPPKAR